MHAASHRRGRARPVADAPVAALVADADELARDWLLALLAAAPLEAVGRVPAAELAAEGPELCATMARALADDEALDALASGGLAARAGRLAGASDPADAAAAVEALRGVLWSAALGALQRPDPGLVAALADRLAAVAAAVTAATLAAPREPRVPWPREGEGAPSGSAAPSSAMPRPAASPPDGSFASSPGVPGAPAPASSASAPSSGAGAAPGAPGPASGGDAPSGASGPAHSAGAAPGGSAALGGAAASGTAASGGGVSVEGAAPSARESSLAAVPDAVDAAEVRARDLRPRIADGAPLELLERAVDAHLRDQRTLAVLLVELDGVERLLAADRDGDAAGAVRRAEAAIEELLRPGDGGRREAPGRIWLALAGTGPAGARALALRVAAAVEREAEHRGTPLTASVGVAVFPVDATDAHALAERAEDALFAARASGSRGAPPAGLR